MSAGRVDWDKQDWSKPDWSESLRSARFAQDLGSRHHDGFGFGLSDLTAAPLVPASPDTA
jgi:hypothetical protein